MSATEKNSTKGSGSKAEDKLTRLLETERDLDRMLEDAKRRAAELVETARAESEKRMRDLESKLEAEQESIRAEIARERDEEIASIREKAQAEARKLEGLSEDTIGALADHVVRLLIGGEQQGGQR
ncbi:MAG TPA: V-type ATPase subunit subunit G family protein [Polyangiales bacterium]|nr:V-type ATPase subunit subunit G family protein [Polyangiales bacterium]